RRRALRSRTRRLRGERAPVVLAGRSRRRCKACTRARSDPRCASRRAVRRGRHRARREGSARRDRARRAPNALPGCLAWRSTIGGECDTPAGRAATQRGRSMKELDDDLRARLDREAHDLAVKRRDPASPFFRGDRRSFVLRSAAVVSGLAALRTASAQAPLGATVHEVPADATKTPGYPLADESYGTRSQFETEVRRRFKTPTPLSSWTMTPLEAGVGIVTPSGLHFERSHGGTAVIDPAKHSLYVHGMVQEPRKYSMHDLRRFPSISRMMFIECSGNGLTEWTKPTMRTVQFTHGLTSTSEWTGVPLSTILNEAGVAPGAKWILAEGGDAAAMTRSIPIDKAMKDCFLAYGQ